MMIQAKRVGAASILLLASVLIRCAGACDFTESHRRLQEEDGARDDLENATTFANWTDDIESFSPTDVMDETEAPIETTAPTEENAYGCAVDPSSVVRGLSVDLRMIARQTRGRLSLIDNCHFQIARLEVALVSDAANESGVALDWYSAVSLEPEHVANRTLLAAGFTASNSVVGNVTHTFPSKDLSLVGAILLVETIGNSTVLLGQALIQKLVPGPAADLLVRQPTVFDNCLSLSPTVRLRWTVQDGTMEMGLEYATADPANTWIAFGPALPGVEDRLMGGSDVVVAGFGDQALAFAEDYYIAGYEVCVPIDDSKYDGVCSDSIWAGNDTSAQNVELLYSHVLEGVAFLRIRRPLQVNSTWDHEITPGIAQNFIWARGPLDPSQGIAKVQFHGYQFGQLKGIDVNATTWDCPMLEGIELEDDASTEPLDPSEDAFALQFEHSTVLQGDVMEVFWTLLPETSQIRLGARVLAKSSSKWMSVAVGDSMTDAWAWVATFDGDPQLLGYRMSGLAAGTVQLLDDQNVMLGEEAPTVSNEGGQLSFEVVTKWPLPGVGEGETFAPLIWALGPSWRGPDAKTPQTKDEHSIRSKAPTTVDFATGSADVGEGPTNAMLLAHAAFMWFAWLVAAPLTAVASRFMRNDPCLADQSGPSWIQIHKNGALAVYTLSIVGLILAVVAVADAGLLHFDTLHSELGIALLSMVTVQNFLGLLRPPADPVPASGFHFTKRRVWELLHRVFAVAMLGMAVATVIRGFKKLQKFDSSFRYGKQLTVAWIVMVAVILVIYEVRRTGIASALRNDTASPTTGETEKEEETGAEEPPMVEPKIASETASPSPSPWTSTLWLVYVMPCILGIVMLVVITAVGFSGSPNLEGAMVESSASQSTEVGDTAESSVPTNSPSTARPTLVPYVPNTSFNTTSKDCKALPLSYVGDGWCDDFEPFNTAGCGWDGGDCCNTKASLYSCRDPASPDFGSTSPKGWASFTIPRNPRYTVTREESLESFVISYNNYYEFGLSKDIAEEANKHADFLAPESWYVDISGLVENPMTLDVKSLISQLQLEERLYRHRCVEAWSITAPWVGFPLSKVLDMVKPKSEAAIVQFLSWKNLTVSKVQATTDYPWPYTEALTIEEAKNELTMLSVGAFGKPLTPQQGAPIRLTVPWKYGFKSIKSIEQINFLADDEENRRTFWSEQNSAEYGFYANVNPEVSHPRWSQATERHYIDGFPGTRLDTDRMNGYHEEVDHLYSNIDDTKIYF